MNNPLPLPPPLAGLHHVTAICADAQANVDFYAGVLGLRLVKRTVNFDDPGSYHLYYGDGVGRPGTILTFFAWPGAYRGRRGTGQTDAVALSVPRESLGYWRERLERAGARLAAEESVAQDPDPTVLAFQDPDGLRLELVGTENSADERAPWDGGPVPAAHAVRRLLGATVWTGADPTPTVMVLTGVLAFRSAGETDGGNVRHRFVTGDDRTAGVARLDLWPRPGVPRATSGAGTVHHLAWRTPDDVGQAAWRAHLDGAGLGVSPVMDRTYFHSIYFREPGGVLFEIATDGPGFAVDEPTETLGERLMLPAWLEGRRAEVEAHLPRLQAPAPEA